MPTSQAETVVSANPNAETIPVEVLTYQSIIDSANEMVVGFLERIPYFVASLIVIVIFWLLSIVFKKVVYKLLGSRSRHQNLVKVFSGWVVHSLFLSAL